MYPHRTHLRIFNNFGSLIGSQHHKDRTILGYFRGSHFGKPPCRASHLSHSQYSVVRNFVCGGHVEQKHCKATGPPEKRHPKFSASSEAVASACWGASSLGCRSMGQENLQVILAAERRQKRHPERHPNLPQQGPCPFCAPATIAECREK